MSHTVERIEHVQLLQSLKCGDESPGATTLRIFRTHRVMADALMKIARGDILPLPLPENFGTFYHTALDQRDIARRALEN